MILIVEDDRWLGDSYERLLRDAAFDVQRAHNASQAMEFIESDIPDGILADMLLEGHTVIALLHELQSYHDTEVVPVILCTNLGRDTFHDIDLAKYGVKAVLDKGTLKPGTFLEVAKEYFS